MWQLAETNGQEKAAHLLVPLIKFWLPQLKGTSEWKKLSNVQKELLESGSGSGSS